MAETTRTEAVLKTLLISDLVGSTRLVEQLGDRRTAQLFEQHDRLARDLMVRHGGLEIDKSDGFLMLFDRPLRAVSYALAYHQALAELGRGMGAELEARVGIHLGEVFLRRNPTEDVARGAKRLEVEGLAKPIAARLMSVARARQTFLSRGAFAMARRAIVGRTAIGGHLAWVSHGTYRFEGIDDPVGVFEVGVEGFAPLVPPVESDKVQRAVGEDSVPSEPLVDPGSPPGEEVSRPTSERRSSEGGTRQELIAQVTALVTTEVEERAAVERARARRRVLAAAFVGLLLFVGAMIFQERRIAREAARLDQAIHTSERLSRMMEQLFKEEGRIARENGLEPQAERPELVVLSEEASRYRRGRADFMTRTHR